MDMSIRFPGLNLVLDHVPRSFEIFGFEITIYGVLIAIGMLLGIFFVVLEARRNHEDPDAYLDLAIIRCFPVWQGQGCFMRLFPGAFIKMIRDSF